MPAFIYSIILIFVSQMAFDIYYPSMPHLTTVFQTTPDAVQYSVAGFVFGTALSRLIFGACIDAWGVRTLLPRLLMFFTVATLGCMWSNSIYVFIACRFLQGGAAGGLFLAAIFLVSAKYDKQLFAKYFSFLSAAWSMGVIIAPIFGGYIHSYLGWRYSFMFIVLAALVLYMLTYFLKLPQTEKKTLSIRETMVSYRQMVVRFPVFLLMIQAAICYGIIITYNTVGPFIFQKGLHFSVVQYAWVTIPISFSYFCGTMINSWLVSRFSTRFIVWVAQIICVCVAVLMTLSAFTLPMHAVLIIVPIMFFFLLDGTMYPNGMSIAVSLFPNAVGKVTALMTICSYLVGGLIALAATALSYHHLRDVSLFLLMLSMCGFLVFLPVYRSKQRQDMP